MFWVFCHCVLWGVWKLWCVDLEGCCRRESCLPSALSLQAVKKLCDINHVWGLTGGWGRLFDQVCGDTPCPHPQLLQQHLFTSSGLSVWKVLLSLSKSYMTHTDNTLTQKRICLVLGGWLGSLQSILYAPNMLVPYWFLALWLDSCWKSKSVTRL